MESTDEEPFFGCGRGGRAALLAAALQRQGSRRPGDLGSEGSSRHTSPSTASSTESGTSGFSSPSLLSASSGSSAVSTLVPHSERVTQDFGAGAAPPGGRATLSVPERNLLHTPARRGALSQMQQQQPGGQHRPPQPAQYGEPQRHPPVPPPGHSSGPAQGAMARPEHSSQLPAGRMADESMEQYDSDGLFEETPPEVSLVRLGTQRCMGLFEYGADFVPAVDSKRARFNLMATEAVTAVIGRTRVFDGHKLFLPQPLRENALSVPTALIPGGPTVVVHIKFVRQASPAECVHIYNVLFKKVMHCLQLAQLGHNYFDREGSVLVPQHKLELWPGQVQSVHGCEGGVLLKCDASFRALRTITAREVLFDVYNAYPHEYEARAMKAIVGAIVMTCYNYRTYRVDDIAWKLKPTSTFTFPSGEKITYKDYYKRIYNLDIEDWDQPLLLHRDKPRKGATEAEEPRLVCLVPELCTLTGLTDTMRSDFCVMKDIAGHTLMSATQRAHALMQFQRNVDECEPARKVLDKWGFALENAFIHMSEEEQDCYR